MLETAKKQARLASAALPSFPSLLISAEGTEARGAFAQAQQAFLQPDARAVDRLALLLEQKRIGIVAHFYMDPQVRAGTAGWLDGWMAAEAPAPPPPGLLPARPLRTDLRCHLPRAHAYAARPASPALPWL